MTRRAAKALAMGVGMTLAGGAVEASCQFEGPYEVVQCGRSAWFAPPPLGAGAVTPVWWQVGMGNATAHAAGADSAPDGSGWIGPPPSPGIFIGNDSGSPGSLDAVLVDASTFPGLGAPAGSLCFNSLAQWDLPGLDGCPDMDRNYFYAESKNNSSDNVLNVYWGFWNGPGYGPYLSSQVDAPMGVLLRESSGLSFALAFFASQNRDHDPFDEDAGRYDMGSIVNGLPGPSGNNVVPWQQVPRPSVATFCEAPACATLGLSFHWTPIAIYSDESLRPCFWFDGTTPCSLIFAPGVTGVGVLDQGPLARYQVERAALNASGCMPDWTAIPGALVQHPGDTLALSGLVPPFCVRLTTQFGRLPQPLPCNDLTPGCVRALYWAARNGSRGDIGYQVSSAHTIIGWPLAAESVTLTSATRGRGGVTVDWTASSELSVTGYDIVALKARGKREVLAASVACRECTTGAAASYSVQVPPWKLRGARSVRVIMRPSGIESRPMILR